MLDIELFNLPLSVQPGDEVSVRLTQADPQRGALVFQPDGAAV